MKVPDTDIDVRVGEPPEKIEMVAHSAECRYCKGIVKMMRDPKTGRLQPDNCQCILCGQRYFVEIQGDIWKWELNQWRQKAEKGYMEKDVEKEKGRIVIGDKMIGRKIGRLSYIILSFFTSTLSDIKRR